MLLPLTWNNMMLFFRNFLEVIQLIITLIRICLLIIPFHNWRGIGSLIWKKRKLYVAQTVRVWKLMFLFIVDFFSVRKIDEKHNLTSSWLSLILFSMKKYRIEIYGECYQKYIQGNHCYKRNWVYWENCVWKLEFIKLLSFVLGPVNVFFYILKWKDGPTW